MSGRLFYFFRILEIGIIKGVFQFSRPETTKRGGIRFLHRPPPEPSSSGSHVISGTTPQNQAVFVSAFAQTKRVPAKETQCKINPRFLFTLI